MRALLTNDDGYDSPGFALLVQCVLDLGWEPFILAPRSAMSGAARSRVSSSRLEIGTCNVQGVEGHWLDSTPAACVVAGLTSGLIPPVDLCISGVNAGENLGAALTVSGTFGAAVEAAARGVRGIAVSRQYDGSLESDPDKWDWLSISRSVVTVLRWASDRGDWALANANVPNQPESDLPVVADPSKVMYFSDVYDLSTKTIVSELRYDTNLLEEADDIFQFAQMHRISVSLFERPM